jgi:hypothetical protein
MVDQQRDERMAAEVTDPSDGVAEAERRDRGDVADVPVDPDVLRDGGPTRTPGMVTTTGGTAGPASVRRGGGQPTGKVAPTTTGDATSGGMTTGTGGATSDNTTGV